MTHAPGCSRPEPTTDGAGQLRCPSCHYLQAKASTSNYRCRVHYETPVSWKGTGCKPCKREAEKRAPKPKDAIEVDPYNVTPRRIRP